MACPIGLGSIIRIYLMQLFFFVSEHSIVTKIIMLINNSFSYYFKHECERKRLCDTS